MISVKIKRADQSEKILLAGLMCKLWPGHTQVQMQEEVEDFLADHNTALFIAWQKEQALGFAQCQLRHDYVEGIQTSPVGYLEGIYVEEAFRKQGIARALLAACEQWAKGMHCTEFASDCELDNVESQRFHNAVGFAEANRIVCFTKSL